MTARPTMTADDRIEGAARRVFEDRRAKRAIADLPEDIRPRDLAEAYRVQDRLLALYLAQGHGPVAGWKIALTTPVMQQLIGLDHPCAGAILADAVHHETAELDAADYASLGVESEIAIRLDRDLAAGGAPWDRDNVADAVDACMAAIEIVDTRHADFGQGLGAGLLIADDAMNHGCVIGPPVADWRRLDLATVAGRMTIDGQVVGEGVGGDALGHPLAALAWLANHLAERGRMLKAGDIVLTGSLVATKMLKPGNRMATVIDGLGTATLRVR